MSKQSTPNSLPAAFKAAIAEQFPREFWRDDQDTLTTYGKDWTRVYAPAPQAVVFPSDTGEVSRFLRLCHAHGVPVVPSGGRTGLAGGAVASQGEIVLSLERMRHMHPVCTLSRTVRVQAGAVTAAVQAHCKPHGLMWPVEFASTGSSHIGGNIATNAGGVRVVRYGLTRQWVLGLQVVTMQGDVLELNGALEKNNTGLDLRQMFIGTEGTLGIITEATLKLAPEPRHSRVALLGVDSLRQALELFQSARQNRALTILAFEYLTDACLQATLAHRAQGLLHPFASPCNAYVLIEVEGENETHTLEAMQPWIEYVFEHGLAQDGVIGQSSKDASSLWALREGISESLARTGFLHKNDVALPIANLADFVDDMDATFATRYPDFAIYLFGHIGDGNLHINIMKPDALPQSEFLARCHLTDTVLFELVQKHQGSVSAEHGIGLLKKQALRFSRSETELALFRAVKNAFDPLGLLNPGKII